jgi:hypothetical protein
MLVTRGPRLPTWVLQQVGSYLGYTGRDAGVVSTAAHDPLRNSRPPAYSRDWSTPLHLSIAHAIRRSTTRLVQKVGGCDGKARAWLRFNVGTSQRMGEPEVGRPRASGYASGEPSGAWAIR